MPSVYKFVQETKLVFLSSIERWRTLSKSYGGSNPKKRGGFFSRQFSPEKDFYDAEKTRGGEISGPQSRFSRESSVESNKSLSSIGS